LISAGSGPKLTVSYELNEASFVALANLRTTNMPDAMPAADVLEREFLQIRARILEVGALLDRLDRGAGAVDNDPRVQQIRRAIETLAGTDGNRAEQIQLLFSLPYHEDWQAEFKRQGWQANGSQ
jgi:hypothetical protein